MGFLGSLNVLGKLRILGLGILDWASLVSDQQGLHEGVILISQFSFLMHVYFNACLILIGCGVVAGNHVGNFRHPSERNE